MKQTIIDIYNLSDFHGAILEENKKVGLVTIATFLNKMKEEKKDSYLFLSDGDMYSGTYFSEITKGKPLTEMLNLLDLTCMGVGNHEIADKELIEEVIKDASFDFINSNVYKIDGSRLLIGKEYLVKVVNGVRVGIIATLGKAQKYDIINTVSRNIVVYDEVEVIKKLSRFLRKYEDCKIIILLSHSNTYNLVDKIAMLKANEMVDVMINGHNHKKICKIIDCNSKRKMAYIESGSSGDAIGNIRLILSSIKQEIKEVYLENIDSFSLYEKNSSYQEMINYYIRDNDCIYNEIGVINNYYNKELFLETFCKYLLEIYQGDIVVLNYGAIRAKGFPLYKKQMINNSNIREINPFNNYFMIGIIDSDVMDFFCEKYSSSLYFSYIYENNIKEVKVIMIDFVYYQNETIFKEYNKSKDNIFNIIYKMIKEERL